MRAQYKDYALTVEVERTLIAKAISDFSRYGQPLADELRVKSIALSRVLSASVYADGTGVIAQALDAGSVVSSTKTQFNVDTTSTARGFIGWVEKQDKVIVKNADGTAAAPTLASGTFSYYLVESVDRDNGTITLVAYLTTGAVGDVDATGITAGDYLYRFAQTTFNDLASISTNDYNTISESFPGLESLAQDDGRKVNGITLTGGVAGTRRDLSGQPIDSHDFQQLMSKVMIAVGQGRYKYDRAMMSWETLDALIESREVDRRFVSVTDNMRGVEGIGYIHGKNKVMFEADEFCPKQRVYVVPNADVLQFHGDDFSFVQAQPGQKFYLKASANGGHARAINAYMEGSGVLVSVHSPAIGVLENFVV
jgi:hypothetical protein